MNEIAPNLKEVDVYTLKASEKMPLGEVMPHFGITNKLYQSGWSNHEVF